MATLPVGALMLGLGAPTAAKADIIQLGFILDSSGSIGSGNFSTITQGLANAIANEVPITGPNQYEISVVTFSTGAVTSVNHVLIDDAATRSAVAAQVAAIPYQAGVTNFQAAFNQLRLTLLDSPLSISASYVNFSTDGQPNEGTTNGVPERNALIAAGIDNISIEGIGGGVDTTFLQQQICYPGPCDGTQPYNFPTQGFYIPVDTIPDYAAAISVKLQTIVNPPPPTGVPEPASIALFGIGLAGLGMVRRRKPA